MYKVTPEKITELPPNCIFVFGSNLAGRHGKGAAKDALKFGAKYGEGDGPTGRCYAIPTKDENLKTLTIHEIGYKVAMLLLYSLHFPNLTFLVTPIGCGLAGYKPSEIGPMFKDSPPNVILPACFLPYV